MERAKRRAAWFLVGAAGFFGLSLIWKAPPAWTMKLLQSMSEAAMVGGLADWFAVAALFRPVNLLGLIPIFPSHTAVIPRSKDRIASSLGDFVRDHFLKTETLVAIVKRNDPAQFVAKWFLEKRNAERFGRHGAKLVAWALNGLHEESVQALISRTIREAFKSVDLSRTSGEVLEAMLSQGRHHELLDEAIAKLTEAFQDPATRATLAAKIAEGIRDEYPKGQLVLPTEAVGRFAAGKIAEWIESYLDNVSKQPSHALREAFDKKANSLIVHLKGDSKFTKKGDEIKDYILNDEKFTGYIASLWTSLRDMVERDLRNEDSEIHQKLVAAGDWIGSTLEKDEELRSSLNRQVESLVDQFGPALGKFVSDHIEGTVKGWNAKAMSTLIEENIGTDLQKIRINGTIIGGLLGGLLFAIAYLSSNHL
ncbi:DUF445 domain-containing protein [Variovorax sp. H27-G14]|uniref:DUF445 domain-containing protein n=1 Tax=Variovorax sp. H27-G14 TaxID=3111914 RepID=UPI0038FD06C0